MTETKLKRQLSLTLVVFYGLGTILGAGVYVLMGVVAEHAGYHTPISFLIASFVAVLTAFSYAELSSRFPQSAGEAIYVQNAFNIQLLSKVVGWSVVVVGMTSSATIAKGFVGYLNYFVQLNPDFVIAALVLFLGGLAIYGILESVALASAITVIEIAGLLIVLTVAGSDVFTSPNLDQILSFPRMENWTGIFAGAFLAFYAFIGFEDIVNVAEEVVTPRINLPKAIFWSMGISSIIYLAVAMTAVTAVPIEKLAGNKAAMALIIETKGGMSPQVIAFISLLAVINGALVQIIMAARVIYGMANMNVAPRFLSHVHSQFRTPDRATVLVTLVILVLALIFPIEKLAQTTSLITLLIFALINIALLTIKIREPGSSEQYRSVSIVFPIFGSLSCLALVFVQLV